MRAEFCRVSWIRVSIFPGMIAHVFGTHRDQGSILDRHAHERGPTGRVRKCHDGNMLWLHWDREWCRIQAYGQGGCVRSEHRWSKECREYDMSDVENVPALLPDTLTRLTPQFRERDLDLKAGGLARRLGVARCGKRARGTHVRGDLTRSECGETSGMVQCSAREPMESRVWLQKGSSLKSCFAKTPSN